MGCMGQFQGMELELKEVRKEMSVEIGGHHPRIMIPNLWGQGRRLGNAISTRK